MLVVTGLAAVVAAGLTVLRPLEDRITVENFERIEEGMTRAEVEAVLGPADDFSTGPLEFAGKMRVFFSGGPNPEDEYVPSPYRDFGTGPLEVVQWRSDHQLIYVNFSPNGHAQMRGCQDVARVEQTAFENLVWRVKRQWHRWFPK